MQLWSHLAPIAACVALPACSASPAHPPPLGDPDAGSQVITHPPPSSGGGSSSSGGPAPADAAGGFVLAGTLTADDAALTPIAGASVCFYGSSVCTTTAANGAFSLGGAGTTDVALRITKSGYTTGIWPFKLSGSDITGLALKLRTTTTTGSWAAELGVSLAGGIVLFVAYAPGDVPLAMVTVQSNPGGSASGYLLQGVDGGGPPMVSSQLSYTTPEGAGLIYGLPAGMTSVTFTKQGVSCAGEGPNGWASTQQNTMVVPVEAGSLTLARASCR